MKYLLLLLVIVIAFVIWQRRNVPAAGASDRAVPVAQLDAHARARIDTALDAGRFVQAVKEYRIATRAGLKESKDEVDLYAAQRRRGAAEPPAAGLSDGGPRA